jgi:hypothetical protein
MHSSPRQAKYLCGRAGSPLACDLSDLLCAGSIARETPQESIPQPHQRTIESIANGASDSICLTEVRELSRIIVSSRSLRARVEAGACAKNGRDAAAACNDHRTLNQVVRRWASPSSRTAQHIELLRDVEGARCRTATEHPWDRGRPQQSLTPPSPLLGLEPRRSQQFSPILNRLPSQAPAHRALPGARARDLR